ncbi:hypothetical protein [Pseudoalteromonas sp. SA25]|uniref:hypothetical protein n=1 Tax=Pseudoalteromonas sp. SA25 TaxID=2686347 RepID=UPI0013FE1681|nr:hypothetical protein [Pseudoalteromonas sp. SA25]
MSNWESCISQAVGAERINNLNNYVSVKPTNNLSPIDEFYGEIQNIINLFPHNVWGTNAWIGSLASIAIVSSVENYFRQVFSKALKACSESQKLAANNNINLGSVIWHPSKELERGAFENISFASGEKIKDTSKKFLGIDMKKNGLEAILIEFDKICELRHGIVHSGNVLGGKNGIKLKLQPTDDISKIDIGFAQFQEIMSVCNALVVDSNKIIFKELAKRWAIDWRNSPSWDPSKQNIKFKELWTIFFSKRDKNNETIHTPLSLIKCRNNIKKEFNIT